MDRTEKDAIPRRAAAMVLVTFALLSLSGKQVGAQERQAAFRIRLPDFDLPTATGERIRSADFVGHEPLLLVFGSVTCPMTASSVPSLKRLYARFGDRIVFLMVYVREAHPGENCPQPRTLDQKLGHAQALIERDEIPWPIVVDDPDGGLHLAMDGKPNAAFLIDRSGRIVFRGPLGR